MPDEPCVDCGDGTCDWAGCDAEGDYRINEVMIRHRGTLIDVGDVYLCGGHMRRLERLGRFELDWERIMRAVS